MNINRIAKTFRCVGRSFQGMEVWKKPNCWGKIISKKNPTRSKGEVLYKAKNSYQRNIQNYNFDHIDFKNS